MGNCMRHEESSSSSANNWGGEDWGSLANDDRDHHKQQMRKTKKIEEEEEDGLLEGGSKLGSYESSKTKAQEIAANTEVKIKMTKKQLEEMMGRVELKQMTVQQVLAQLIMSVSATSSSDLYVGDDHQRPWRPVLQSIPEVN